MALLGATRSLQLAVKIQSHLILLPMAKKGFSSSGPVRYVPGAYTPTNKAQEASPLESSKKKVLESAGRRRSNGGKNGEEVLGYEDKRIQDRPSDDNSVISNDLSAQFEDLLGAIPEPCCNQVYYEEFKNDSKFLTEEALSSCDPKSFAEDKSTNEVKHDEEQATNFLAARMQKAVNSSDPVRNLLGKFSKIDSMHKGSSLETFEEKGAYVVGDRRLNCIKRTNANAIVSYNDETFHNRLDVDLEESCDLSGDFGEHFENVDAVDNASGILMEGNSNSFQTTNVNEKITSEIRQTVEKTAIDLLAARSFTMLELRKKLHAKRYPSAVIDSVIAEMKCRGLLNDGLYAESYARSRWLSSNWGPRRIKQVLVQKGVNSGDADKATRLVFDDDPSCSEGCTQFGMSKLSMERLFLQVSKQWKRGEDTSLENRKARVARWLQYRGFSWGVISLMLRKLQSQFPQ